MNLKKKINLICKINYFHKLKYGKIKRSSGRNNFGKVTVRSRGFINKKKRRIIDYFRCFWHVSFYVFNFEYDPNRKTLVSLLIYITGLISYSISLEKYCVGFHIKDGNKNKTFYGSSSLISKIPKKVKICNLEISLYKGFKMLRSSSSFGKIILKNKNYCLVKLKSKKIKKVNPFCTAVVGSILNFNFYLNKYKKASHYLFKGFKPKVRGVAMNPIDHPHGGGEGKKSKKMNPMSPWGKKYKFKKKWKKKEIF